MKRVLLALEIVILITLICSLFASDHSFAIQNVDSEYRIYPGSYTVTVSYETDNVGSKYVSFMSVSCPSALMEETITLDGDLSEKSGDILVKYGSKVEDLTVSIDNDEGGYLSITGISLKENHIYRFTRLVMFLLIALILDWICFVLLADIGGWILLATLLFACLPLFNNNIYYGHDIEFHLNRIFSVANEISKGNIPVRIQSDMLNGYGYATSLFYCDSLLYVPAVLYLAKMPLSVCYQIYILLNNVLTVWFSYLCFKNMNIERKYVFLGVFLYTLAPYRLVNIYTRAAVGEFTAMTFLPLVVLGFWNIYTNEKNKVIDYLPAVIGLSGIIQSHLISTEMTAVFIVIFCILEWRKTFSLEKLKSLVGVVVLTALANCWFLLPMVDSMSMNINATGRSSRIQEQGLYLAQIMSMFFAATGKSLKNTAQDEMGFSLGIALIIGLMVAFYVYLKYLKDKERKHLEKYVVLTSVMGVIAICFACRFFPWDILADRSSLFAKYFCMIQYPWRYLSMATILLTVATIGAFSCIDKVIDAKIVSSVVVVMVILSFVSIEYYYYDFMHESSEYIVMSETSCNDFYIGDEEYLPVGTDVELLRTRNVIHGENVIVTETQDDAGNIIFECENISDTDETIVLPIINYEHYVVIDVDSGKYFEVGNGENNCISVVLTGGFKGRLTARYNERLLWKICDIISLVTLIYIIAMYMVKNKQLKVQQDE